MSDQYPGTGGPFEPPTQPTMPPGPSAVPPASPPPEYQAPPVPVGAEPPVTPGFPAPPPGSAAHAASEYLDSGQGVPLTPAGSPPPRRSRKGLWIGGGAVGLVALAGAGAWAFVALSGGGPQPAEALPKGTLAYVSVDLDPSASQKIEAIKMLKKFPSIDKELGLDTQDDLRKELFDAIQKDEKCKNLDYEDDFGWVGNRAAFAAVDTGADSPSPVLVLASTDAKAAEAGLRAVSHCVVTGDADEAGDTAADMGWEVTDGWVVIAQSDDIAKQVTKDAGKANLADDSDYQKWMDEIGDRGIVTMYAAPDAGQALADYYLSQAGDLPLDSDMTDAVETSMSEFSGMAGTLRFHDGSLQFEYAAGTTKESASLVGERGDDMVATLPKDTAMVVGFGLKEGWLSTMLDQLQSAFGNQLNIDDAISELESQSGLQVPEDLETLFGDSAALVVGGDFDAAQVEQSSPADLPLALKVHGDPAKIQEVLDKLTGQMSSSDAEVLGTSTEGDVIVIGPNADYRESLLEKGSLGDSESFRAVVTESSKASMVMYVDFDANDWLVKAVGDDEETVSNVKPLSSIGVSAWTEGDVAHGQFQLSTD